MIKSYIADTLQHHKSPPGEYAAYIPNHGSSHCLVYCGALGGTFAGITSVKSMGVNGLMIRSDPHTWYCQSYGSLGDSPQKLAESLMRFLDTQKHIKTVTLAGYSMGGYGALLLGTWMKVDRIVSTAPQCEVPTFHVEGKLPNIDPVFDNLKSIKHVWSQYGTPKCEVILQACRHNNPKEEFRDADEVQDLASQFPDINVNWYGCVGHRGLHDKLVSTHNRRKRYELLFDAP